MTKRLGVLLALLILCISCAALGEETGTRVEEVVIPLGKSELRYPQLRGSPDEQVQAKINDAILLSCDLSGLLVKASTGKESAVWMDCQSFLTETLFSVAITTRTQRADGVWESVSTAATYDLADGNAVGLERLFQDRERAVKKAEEIALLALREEMNEYTEAGATLPLPEKSFALDERGATFYYPAEQFSFPSGASGAVHFFFEELDGEWTPEIERLFEAASSREEAGERKRLIEEAVSQGKLPALPVRLGDGMQEITEEYRLLRAPDAFPGGRYFLMEAPLFRQIYLISDDMQSGYENSTLKGIQLRRGSLYGFQVGETSRSEWLSVLGQPGETILVTESMAFDYQLPAGSYDVYAMGERKLRLYADDAETLVCIQID